VVISARQKPFQDNGIKFFSREGIQARRRDRLRIEELCSKRRAKEAARIRSLPDDIGKAPSSADALGR